MLTVKMTKIKRGREWPPCLQAVRREKRLSAVVCFASKFKVSEVTFLESERRVAQRFFPVRDRGLKVLCVCHFNSNDQSSNPADVEIVFLIGPFPPSFSIIFGLFKLGYDFKTNKCGKLFILAPGFELTTSPSHNHQGGPGLNFLNCRYV